MLFFEFEQVLSYFYFYYSLENKTFKIIKQLTVVTIMYIGSAYIVMFLKGIRKKLIKSKGISQIISRSRYRATLETLAKRMKLK